MSAILSRVSTFGQAQQSTRNIFSTQSSINDLTAQISSEHKSRQYTGISRGSNLLVNVENSLKRADEYRESIAQVKRRTDQAEQNTKDIYDLATEFKKTLVSASNASNAQDIPLDTLGRQFFEQVASFLNQQIDNDYIFGGTRTDRPAVSDFDTVVAALKSEVAGGKKLNVGQLAPSDITITDAGAAQGLPLRAAQVLDYFLRGGEYGTLNDNFPQTVSPPAPPYMFGSAGGQANINAFRGTTGRGDLSIIQSTGFTAPTTGTLQIRVFNSTGTLTSTHNVAVTAGDTMATISANINALANVNSSVTTAGGEDRINFGVDNTVLPNGFVEIGTVDAATDALGVTGGPNRQYVDFQRLFYSGDQFQNNAQVEDNLKINYGVHANDSGFEKVLLAGFILAGGAGGSNGVDLDASTAGNQTLDISTRINAAMKLLDDALKDGGDPDSLTGLRGELGTTQIQLQVTTMRHDAYEISAEELVTKIERVDVAEAATLLAQKRLTLETSYLAISSLSQLTLANFLR
ncbi:MAG: hypothetical protein JNK11_01530 [Alphaproteobacteria bacterium]|nr:hypothetical protein [Alphaproteobacteria bacterium]